MLKISTKILNLTSTEKINKTMEIVFVKLRNFFFYLDEFMELKSKIKNQEYSRWYLTRYSIWHIIRYLKILKIIYIEDSKNLSVDNHNGYKLIKPKKFR